MTYPAEHSLTAMYTEEDRFAGVTGRRRKQLLLLHRAFHGPFDALRAAPVLDLDIKRTRRILAALAGSGWLARVRRGWYIGVPIEASAPGEWREDPWVVATTLFSPGYIGGWSAVEHWGLTDQIFNVIYVVAGAKSHPDPADGPGNGLLDPNRARTGPVWNAPRMAPECAGQCVRPSSDCD